MDLNIGDYCKHFKGKDLVEKNIYKIIAKGVIYTGENANAPLDNLVVYKNIFAEGKIFTREYSDLVEELSEEKKKEYDQTYRVEKLTDEEMKFILSKDFIQAKIEYLKEREK